MAISVVTKCSGETLIYIFLFTIGSHSEVQPCWGTHMRRLVASFYYELNGGLFTFYETKVAEISHFDFVHYVLLDAYTVLILT